MERHATSGVGSPGGGPRRCGAAQGVRSSARDALPGPLGGSTRGRTRFSDFPDPDQGRAAWGRRGPAKGRVAPARPSAGHPALTTPARPGGRFAARRRRWTVGAISCPRRCWRCRSLWRGAETLPPGGAPTAGNGIGADASAGAGPRWRACRTGQAAQRIRRLAHPPRVRRVPRHGHRGSDRRGAPASAVPTPRGPLAAATPSTRMRSRGVDRIPRWGMLPGPAAPACIRSMRDAARSGRKRPARHAA